MKVQADPTARAEPVTLQNTVGIPNLGVSPVWVGVMRRFLSSRLGGEQGIALPLVIGVTAVLLLLASVAVTYSVGGLKQSKATEDWSAALSAAYAGIEEYQSRIADDATYMQYVNPRLRPSRPAACNGAHPARRIRPWPASGRPARGQRFRTPGDWMTR